MVDEIHKRPEGTAKRTYDEHRDRFVEDEDFVTAPYDALWSDAIRPTKGGNRKPIVLITRRGYLKLVKPMSDDRAWEVQGEMIDRYFMMEQIASSIDAGPEISPWSSGHRATAPTPPAPERFPW